MNLNLINDQLAAICLVANTPSYLYRQFRSDTSIEAFAKSATTEELFQFIYATAANRNRSLVDQCRAYAALAALSYKPLSEVDAQLKSQGLPKMRWAKELIEIIRANFINTKIISLGATFPEPKLNPTRPITTATNSTVHVKSVLPSAHLILSAPQDSSPMQITAHGDQSD